MQQGEPHFQYVDFFQTPEFAWACESKQRAVDGNRVISVMINQRGIHTWNMSNADRISASQELMSPMISFRLTQRLMKDRCASSITSRLTFSKALSINHKIRDNWWMGNTDSCSLFKGACSSRVTELPAAWTSWRTWMRVSAHRPVSCKHAKVFF